MHSIVVIPIFGVLTKKDKAYNVEYYENIEQKFTECLGLEPHRFLLMSNYCKDVDSSMTYRQRVTSYPLHYTNQLQNVYASLGISCHTSNTFVDCSCIYAFWQNAKYMNEKVKGFA